MMISTVTVRGQTAIPINIRKKYNIKPQMTLEWIDDGHTITVVPVPQDPIAAMKGRLKGTGLYAALMKSREEERKHG